MPRLTRADGEGGSAHLDNRVKKKIVLGIGPHLPRSLLRFPLVSRAAPCRQTARRCVRENGRAHSSLQHVAGDVKRAGRCGSRGRGDESPSAGAFPLRCFRHPAPPFEVASAAAAAAGTADPPAEVANAAEAAFPTTAAVPPVEAMLLRHFHLVVPTCACGGAGKRAAEVAPRVGKGASQCHGLGARG